MKRRTLLAAAAAASLPPLLPALRASAAPLSRRRVRPGDPLWPDPEQWRALNRRVGGTLIRPAALLAPCQSDPDGAVCARLKHDLRNPYFLGDQPGGTQVSGWLDAWEPQPSAYAVAARHAGDVAAAIDFARHHDLRIVVKGGGHSYQGTSNAPDSLLIWTRRMRAITPRDDFVPAGCAGGLAATQAVTVEAGAMWMDVYDAVTTKAGRYVQGGGCATVGVAGLIQSGGFGSFSKRFGVAAAGLLEAEIVTADGAVRTVNACREPDLFWALKGGGGGTFGVVTKLTLRTRELPEYFGGATATIRAATDPAFARLVAEFLEFYAASLLNPHWGETVTIRPDNRLDIAMVSQGLDRTESKAVWQPFLDRVAASPDAYRYDAPLRVGVRAARGWWDARERRSEGSNSVIFDDRPDAEPAHAWWKGDQEQVGAFLYGYDSLWLPVSLLAPDSRDRLAGALFAASRHTAVQLHCNKGLAGAPPEAVAAARDTAMHPDAATAFALAIVATGGPPAYPGIEPPPSLDTARSNALKVRHAAAELRNIAPRAGSYVSESDYFNRDWQTAFWGEANYRRLLAVKRKYDPDGLFYVHHGVGSEAWHEGGFVPA